MWPCIIRSVQVARELKQIRHRETFRSRLAENLTAVRVAVPERLFIPLREADLFVHVQPATTLVQDIHVGSPLCRTAKVHLHVSSLFLVLSFPRRQFTVPNGGPARLNFELGPVFLGHDDRLFAKAAAGERKVLIPIHHRILFTYTDLNLFRGFGAHGYFTHFDVPI